MPIYEYVCHNCGHHFDVLRAMRAADDPIACQKCSGVHTQRALSLFNAHSSGGSPTPSGRCGCGNCKGGSCAGCRH